MRFINVLLTYLLFPSYFAQASESLLIIPVPICHRQTAGFMIDELCSGGMWITERVALRADRMNATQNLSKYLTLSSCQNSAETSYLHQLCKNK